MTEADRRLRDDEKPTLAIVLVWLAVSAILLGVGASKIASGDYHGPDDALRMVQVRDLLAGQAWYDLHQYRMTPPDGTLMHWSRLVDIPIALSVMFFSLFLEPAMAERVAMVIVPLLVLLATMLVIGRLAWRLFDRQTAVFACAVLVIMPVIAVQFQPMRIDHHGWQVFTIALAVWSLSWRSAAHGGVLAGIAMAFGLMISLEPVFVSAAIGGVLLLRWLRDPKQRWWLVSYLQALALGLVVLFAATRGLPDLAAHCDAISPPHLGFFLIAALGTGALAVPTKIPRIPLLIGLVVTAVAGAAFVGWSAPQCLAPPFSNLDPLVKEFWYESVGEGRPVWRQSIEVAIPGLVQPIMALAITIGLAARSRDWKREWWVDYTIVLLAAFLSGVVTFRSIAFAGMLCAIPFGWLLTRAFARWRKLDRLLPKLGIAIGLYFVFIPSFPLILLKQLMPKEPEAETGQLFGSTNCDLSQNAPSLNRLAQGRILAPLDMGPVIIYHTHHGVVASGHHRAETAMRDVIRTFVSSPDAARRSIDKYGADYVLVCTDLMEPKSYQNRGGSDALMTRLIEGDPPEWLEEVELGGPDELRAWRVIRD